MNGKVDNKRLDAKLLVRRYFLDRYHSSSPPRVIDCCAGSGVIWQALRQDYRIRSYWGLDAKKSAGRIAARSERILECPGWQADIVDVDTYGSPWKHWAQILSHGPTPLTVFLTVGQVVMGASTLSAEALVALGVVFPTLAVSPGLMAKIHPLVIPFQLTYLGRSDKVVVEAKQIIIAGLGATRVVYVGLRLEESHHGGRNRDRVDGPHV